MDTRRLGYRGYHDAKRSVVETSPERDIATIRDGRVSIGMDTGNGFAVDFIADLRHETVGCKNTDVPSARL